MAHQLILVTLVVVVAVLVELVELVMVQMLAQELVAPVLLQIF